MPLLPLLALALLALTLGKVARVVWPLAVAGYVQVARELDPRDAHRQPDFVLD